MDVKDWTNLLLFVAVVILLFIIFIEMGSKGTQCTLNPLQYGAKELREANNREVECQCMVISDSYRPSPILLFNHNSSQMLELPEF